jgi:hypothetical protein
MDQHNTKPEVIHADLQATHVADTSHETHSNTNKTAIYILDIGILFLAVLIIVVLRKTALGERLGKLLTIINVGIVAIAINHLLDTMLLHDALAGKMIFNHQAVLLGHHVGNLVGFFLMFVGYYLGAKKLHKQKTGA